MTEQPQEPTTEAPRERIRIKMPQAKPVATISLIVFTTILYVFQYLQTATNNTDTLFLLGGKINVLISAGQVWRLITPVFLHGSIAHLGFNMYALYIIGRNLERFYGHGRFLLLYFLGAFGGNVLSYVLSPASSLGASTALFAILAAEGVFTYGNRRLFGPQRTKQMITNLVVVTLVNLSFGLIPGFNVDSWGHIGGILAGISLPGKPAHPADQRAAAFLRDGRYPQKERGLAHHADRPGRFHHHRFPACLRWLSQSDNK